MRSRSAFLVALLLATSACDRSPSQAGDSAASQVEPKQVSAEALQAAVTDPRVRRFYEARGWKAAWNEDQARELTEALREAPRHGLEAVNFLKQTDAADDPVAREATLSLGAISYADALANGAVDPAKVSELYTIPANRLDVATGLNKAVDGGDVGTWLAELAPRDEEYKALSDAFVRYSQAAKGQKANVPAGDAIEPGDDDPRVTQIAAALQANGYLEGEAAQAAGTGPRYTPALADAVKRLQGDYGLKPDGVIGSSTLEALNAGAADRARTLAINLERRRWLQRTPPETRIDVNTAAAMLAYYRDGNVKDRRRVVVGQPDWETPELGSPIFRLVANPPWNVPDSIEKDELSSRSAASLAADGFTRKEGRWVQEPGPDSALGLVKFDMENDEAIYLHDTPAKALFESDERHASHGCVRVHNAVQFAQMLAQDEGKRAEFDEAMASKKETFVDLPNKIPVRLLYHTAFVDNGRVVFRPDSYGWDERVAQGLGLTARVGGRKVIRTHANIMGP